jgi:ParB family chromosome partitioning protein
MEVFMAKKLGKGIIRLLENVEDQRLDSDGAVLNIDINKIKQNPDQPRKSFDEETINELAASIKEYGILQPLILKREGEEYIIVAGERRYRAAIKAGLSSVPALVKNINDQKSGEISLIENLQREDLNAIEAARAMKELMEKYDLTQDELAAKLGKARSSIANTIRLLLLDEKVQTMVMENKLSAGHAKALITVADKEQQIKFAEEAIEKQLSVRELEKKVRYYFHPEKAPKKMKEEEKIKISAELKRFVEDLKRIFVTRVKIVGNDNKGRISIDYFTNDDLQRIYEIMEKLK